MQSFLRKWRAIDRSRPCFSTLPRARGVSPSLLVAARRQPRAERAPHRKRRTRTIPTSGSWPLEGVGGELREDVESIRRPSLFSSFHSGAGVFARPGRAWRGPPRCEWLSNDPLASTRRDRAAFGHARPSLQRPYRQHALLRGCVSSRLGQHAARRSAFFDREFSNSTLHYSFTQAVAVSPLAGGSAQKKGSAHRKGASGFSLSLV